MNETQMKEYMISKLTTAIRESNNMVYLWHWFLEAKNDLNIFIPITDNFLTCDKCKDLYGDDCSRTEDCNERLKRFLRGDI